MTAVGASNRGTTHPSLLPSPPSCRLSTQHLPYGWADRQGSGTATFEQNEAIIRRLEEAWQADDWETQDELFAPDMVSDAAVSHLPPGPRGLEDVYAAAADRRAVRPDRRSDRAGRLARSGLNLMPIDEALLERHRRFRDERAGIEEEFLQPFLGGARTVATLSRPLGRSRPMGWVVCHSFGIEQVTLHRLEVVTARALAAAGFPVLRFHVQGYGDSERRGTVVEVSSHLDGALDAVALMRAVGGLEAVGMFGVRFGALVAALTAEPAGLAAMALWHPFLTGTQFLTEFATTAMFERMLDGAETGERASATFAGGFGPEGWKDLNGFRLGRQAVEEISAIDLRRDIPAYRGSVLVGAITRSGALPRPAVEVAEHLRNVGTHCEERTVRDDSAPMLGQHQFKKIGDGEVERDIFVQAFRSVGEMTSTWAASLATGLGPAGPGA